MTPHKTPVSLNDNLRLGRLTLPQWVAIGVGVVALFVMGSLTSGIHNPDTRVFVILAPVVVLVAPILAFGRGGIERYPSQSLRFAWRRTLRYGVHAARTIRASTLRGANHATKIYRQARHRRT